MKSIYNVKWLSNMFIDMRSYCNNAMFVFSVDIEKDSLYKSGRVHLSIDSFPKKERWLDFFNKKEERNIIYLTDGMGDIEIHYSNNQITIFYSPIVGVHIQYRFNKLNTKHFKNSIMDYYKDRLEE